MDILPLLVASYARAIHSPFCFPQVHNIIVNQVLFPELSGGSRLLDARIRMQQVRLECMLPFPTRR